MTLHSSQMGRGGHRDDRRRRLLTEDLTANSGMPAPDISGASLRISHPPVHKSENYGDAEFLQIPLRLTDLIPMRLVSYLLLLKLGLAVVGGLMALHVWIPDLFRDPQFRPAMADLGNCGSLGSWFASLLLLTAGLLAIVIYRVRRHKVDDYRGHYQIWLWAAACWLIMATDAAASLHQGFQQAMISMTGTQIVGDGSIWWVVPTLLLMGFVGSRLLIDMWLSRLSSAALILSMIAYLTALTAFFHGIVLPSEVSQLLLVQGSLLGGHVLLAVSMGLHARYVILDAEGVLPKRVAKKKLEKKLAVKVGAKADQAKEPSQAKDPSKNNSPLPYAGEGQGVREDKPEKDSAASGRSDAADSDDGTEESGDTWVVVDPPHGNLQPVLKRVMPSETSAVPSLSQKIAIPGAETSSRDSASDDNKLSKADRKALKRKLIDERLKREQRNAANW
ncbi:MAG: hypothetical protein WCJ35_20165 [Planctomycetota bacterium]